MEQQATIVSPELRAIRERLRETVESPGYLAKAGDFSGRVRRADLENRQRVRRETAKARGVPERVLGEMVPLRRTSSFKRVRKFLRSDGWMLVLGGVKGVGKTYAGAWNVAVHRRSAGFVSVGDLLAAGEFDPEMRQRITKPHLLVLDDLGREHTDKSDWALGYLWRVFDARYRANSKTIVTTNASFDAFRAAYGKGAGELFLDRLRQGGAFFEPVETASMRGAP